LNDLHLVVVVGGDEGDQSLSLRATELAVRLRNGGSANHEAVIELEHSRVVELAGNGEDNRANIDVDQWFEQHIENLLIVDLRLPASKRLSIEIDNADDGHLVWTDGNGEGALRHIVDTA
jgi:hypothetical protein